VVIGAAICIICEIGENYLCSVVDSGVSGNKGWDKDIECQR
jgi:hypothetical protein